MSERAGGIPISPLLPFRHLSSTPFKTAAARAWGKWLLKFDCWGIPLGVPSDARSAGERAGGTVESEERANLSEPRESDARSAGERASGTVESEERANLSEPRESDGGYFFKG